MTLNTQISARKLHLSGGGGSNVIFYSPPNSEGTHTGKREKNT